MPVVRIRSLAFEPKQGMSNLLTNIAEHFAKHCKVKTEHLSIDWCFIAAGHYYCAGQSHQQQHASSPPVQVQLLVPDVHSQKRQQEMLVGLAEAISHQSGIALGNIFIDLQLAESGTVFDDGKLMTWPKKH